MASHGMGCITSVSCAKDVSGASMLTLHAFQLPACLPKPLSCYPDVLTDR